MPFYVVGVKPDNTADSAYWLDRFEKIEAATEGEAVEKWKEMRKGWLRPDEIRHIRIWDTLTEKQVECLAFDWADKYKHMPLRAAKVAEVKAVTVVFTEADASQLEKILKLDMDVADPEMWKFYSRVRRAITNGIDEL